MISVPVKKNANGLSDYNKDNDDLSDKKEKSHSDNKKNHSNPKVNMQLLIIAEVMMTSKGTY